MAIKQLTDEQVRTMTVLEKDRWWLANVWRGDMPQLTLRSGITGFVLGGLLSATNLYVGAKTGWTLGVGLTSVILAFAMFFALGKLQAIGGWPARGIVFVPIAVVLALAGWLGAPAALASVGVDIGAAGGLIGVAIGVVLAVFCAVLVVPTHRPADFTILENNCTQSIATAAGYMTGPLISGMAAYMWIENRPMPWWQMLWFNVVLSILGVLVAFPMKRRFINDEQQPFPEGRACGVVLDTLYTSAAAVGLFKAKALAVAALAAGFITFISGEAYLKAIRGLAMWVSTGGPWADFLAANRKVLDTTWHLPHNLDPLYAWLAKTNSEPRLAGVTFKQLGINPALDLAMIGAGGLMGIRAASSMMIGMILNFFIIVPWMISIGEIRPQFDLATGLVKTNAAGEALFGRAWILNSWALWWGITIMVVASMVSLFAKPQIFVEAFRMLFGKKKDTTAGSEDPLRDIELPLWISVVGVPIFGAIGVWMAHDWFGVSWVFGALAIPMIIVLTLIAASSTGMTGITPSGSLSKIPQFIFGAADPKHPPTNLMTGVMCVEVASNASNLLTDIKPGYMLGGKPRHQAIGHCIGIMSGAIASTMLFFPLFTTGFDPAKAATDPTHLQSVMASESGQFGFPSAVQWKGVSELVTSIFGESSGTLLTPSIVTSMLIAAFVGLVFEILRIVTRNKFPISALAIGLGVVVPAESTLCMFLGALFFWAAHKVYHARTWSLGWKLWVDTHEPICAGIIAGAALVGIGDVLVKVFLLG
jgi:uncharacterized oligopeptide transporter (OPT) family protein